MTADDSDKGRDKVRELLKTDRRGLLLKLKKLWENIDKLYERKACSKGKITEVPSANQKSSPDSEQDRKRAVQKLMFWLTTDAST